MEVTFINPGVDYMIQSIMHFQAEGEAEFWSEPLYHFYPQLDRTFAASLPVAERRDYIERTMRAAYAELENTIDEKVTSFSHHWNACKAQITAALSEAFGIDCTGLFNDLRCNLSLNPIEPRFLKEHCYDTFYLNSAKVPLAVEYMRSYTLFGSMYGTSCLEITTTNMSVPLSNGY